MVKIINFIWRCIGITIPLSSGIVVISTFPDFDDACRSLCLELIRRNKKVFIITDGSIIPPINFPKISGAYRKNNLIAIYIYHRAKYIFFTHGLYSDLNIAKNKIVVNLWHGMPIKKIGLLDDAKFNNVPKFSYTIATNSYFAEIISKAFGVNKNRVIISDHPRLDIISNADNNKISEEFFPSEKKLLLWLPTYRKSNFGQIRFDGDIESIGDVDFLRILDRVFLELNIFCLIKPHPMSNISIPDSELYSSIKFINDNFLRARGIGLYGLLGYVRYVVTDISSVYFETTSIGIETLVFCEDFEKYKVNRGFVDDISNLIVHPIIKSREEFLLKIYELNSGVEKIASAASITGLLFDQLNIK